jgi:hypothetical protein
LDAAQLTKDSGPHAFRGLNHLEGFLPLSSEGYKISKARTSSMADLLLLHNLSTLYSLFSCLMFSHTSSFLGAYRICVHHPSMFCACHLPPLFLHAFFLRISLYSLFMCTPNYLFGGDISCCYFLSRGPRELCVNRNTFCMCIHTLYT